jgi:hypothetical protein
MPGMPSRLAPDCTGTVRSLGWFEAHHLDAGGTGRHCGATREQPRAFHPRRFRSTPSDGCNAGLRIHEDHGPESAEESSR